jgi:3-hydroxymyristoyl/3-hydroxydecanoyl-(acyl carrier protein) dehydratase
LFVLVTFEYRINRKLILFPEIREERITPQNLVLALRIPKELAYFTGHFDEISVVPGVVQIQWAMHYAKERLNLDKAFSHMEAIKFKELLLPDQCLELSLCYCVASYKLTFRYLSNATEYSSGRIYFHDHNV